VRGSRLFFLLATLLDGCGAIAPGPPICEEITIVRPCPDASVPDAPADVMHYVDAPIIAVVPAAADPGAIR
jgi:hypothetical protein